VDPQIGEGRRRERRESETKERGGHGRREKRLWTGECCVMTLGGVDANGGQTPKRIFLHRNASINVY
jgi:hypothetical protein